MRTAIILHGTCDQNEFYDPAFPSLSNSHWLPWLQKQLLINGYVTQTPEMPNAFAPDYGVWKSEFERCEINAESILVGHSCGGGFLLRWLSENPVAVRRVALVAPWLDPDAAKCPEFFDFSIDGSITKRCDLHVLNSDNDDADIHESVRRICVALPDATRHDFKSHGHFCFGDLGTVEFPALRDILLGT